MSAILHHFILFLLILYSFAPLISLNVNHSSLATLPNKHLSIKRLLKIFICLQSRENTKKEREREKLSKKLSKKEKKKESKRETK